MSAQRLTCWDFVLFRSLMLACALWLVSPQVSSLLAQTSPVPYVSDVGPSFHLQPYSYLYPNSYQSIRDLDFKNLRVPVGTDENGKPSLIQLRNGVWEVKYHNDGYDWVVLKGAHILDSAEPGREYALTVYAEVMAGGSSTEFGLAKVFELVDKRLRVTQLIDWDLRYGGPDHPLDISTKRPTRLPFARLITGPVIITNMHLRRMS